MSEIWHGDWTEEDKREMRLAIAAIEKDDPNMRMTDKEHHDFMVNKKDEKIYILL
jgi:hypothetical protein